MGKRWSASPLGMLCPKLDATLVSSGNASRIKAAGRANMYGSPP